ncbi:MAG TPA: PmoA family protein [Puia sp.]|nr:PmoA family protein [Puia sp.]
MYSGKVLSCLTLELALFMGGLSTISPAQDLLKVQVSALANEKRILVQVQGKPFTEFIYADSLEKPVLYPIYSAGEYIVTRGFPLRPRVGESTDHPHHLGLWFNYENVNGLDFWNNSYAIAPDKKNTYGWIVTDSILLTKSGTHGAIRYSAHWEDQQHTRLISESTSFIFSADKNKRIIDRLTKLTALTDLSFPDSKDGMLGLRVTRELQIPSLETKQYADNKGNISSVSASADSLVNGNYLSSEGNSGNDVWGKRAIWCLLYGKIRSDTISIAIIDHPGNPGYPTYWHARGYGLFAANPLGQKIFSNGREALNFSLKKGMSAIFRFRIVLATGKNRLSNSVLNELASSFAKSAE